MATQNNQYIYLKAHLELFGLFVCYELKYEL